MKRIKHYKVKPEHLTDVEDLCCASVEAFHSESDVRRRLERAKVLNIWCEPVYEKEKVELDLWMNVYQSGATVYTSRELADRYDRDRIGLIHIKGSFENLLE